MTNTHKCDQCGATSSYPCVRLNPRNWHEERAMLCHRCQKQGGYRRTSRISMGVGRYEPTSEGDSDG